jgi:hypothetical protein
MFPGLWHDPLVCGDNKGQQIHTGYPGHHILDKFLMAGDIDNTKPVTAGKIKIGKPKLNGDSPFLLLLQPVGFNPRQGSNQAGFAMVNMTRGTKNNFAHMKLE